MSMRRPGSRRQASVDFPKYPSLNSTTQQPYIQPEMISQTMLASDYDSDNQGYISDYQGLTVLTPRTKEELNLLALQKWNPDIVSIMSIAPYATLYEFAATANEWQKSGLVGTLFICRLNQGKMGEDRYRAVILNRSGLDNYEADLRQSERGGVSISGDYVEVIKEDSDTGEIKANAIYIYSEEGTSTAGSRQGNADLMVALANAAKLSRDAAEVQAFSPVRPVDTPQTEPFHDNHYAPQFQPEQQPERVYIAQQPSPAPPVTPAPAPAPARQVDLLALFRGHQSDADSVISRPPETCPSMDVMELFRKSGAL